MRVSERPTASARIARRGPAGNVPAADASAPICSACPAGKASFRLPENEVPWTCPKDCSAIGTRLVEQDFHAVRQQRRRDRDQQRMVAGAPQRLDERARSDPTGGGEKDLFVGTPGQGARVSSEAGAVSRAIARAIATSGPIVRTVIGKLGRAAKAACKGSGT
jgi:hypothetical protein